MSRPLVQVGKPRHCEGRVGDGEPFRSRSPAGSSSAPSLGAPVPRRRRCPRWRWFGASSRRGRRSRGCGRRPSPRGVELGEAALDAVELAGDRYARPRRRRARGGASFSSMSRGGGGSCRAPRAVIRAAPAGSGMGSVSAAGTAARRARARRQRGRSVRPGTGGGARSSGRGRPTGAVRS
jgi:hypothetical protein